MYALNGPSLRNQNPRLIQSVYADDEGIDVTDC